MKLQASKSKASSEIQQNIKTMSKTQGGYSQKLEELKEENEEDQILDVKGLMKNDNQI